MSVTLRQRIAQLKKAEADLPQVLRKTAKAATQRAVEVTMDATPPKAGTGRGSYIGVNMISGDLKASWATASQIEPTGGGTIYMTTLANDMQYASFVNDGHRMDKHFVPGLYVDNGVLNRDLSRDVGLVVGTKTRYVKGEFMVDKGKQAYQETVESELDAEIQRLMK